MDTEIIAVYCLCDDFLKAMRHVDDRQSQMSDAEVMSTAVVASLHFGGNMAFTKVAYEEEKIRASNLAWKNRRAEAKLEKPG